MEITLHIGETREFDEVLQIRQNNHEDLFKNDFVGLCSGAPSVKLLIREAHKENLHSGVSHTLNNIRRLRVYGGKVCKRTSRNRKSKRRGPILVTVPGVNGQSGTLFDGPGTYQ